MPDPTKCPVHGLELISGTCPIVYGLLVDPYYEPGEEKNFPYANDLISGGCLVGGDQPTSRNVLFCPECRKAKKKWKKKQEEEYLAPIRNLSPKKT